MSLCVHYINSKFVYMNGRAEVIFKRYGDMCDLQPRCSIGYHVQQVASSKLLRHQPSSHGVIYDICKGREVLFLTAGQTELCASREKMLLLSMHRYQWRSKWFHCSYGLSQH